MSDDPEVTALPGGPGNQVQIICPYCGQKHTHGWPEPELERDHRVRHCLGLGGYWINRPSAFQAPSPDGRE